MSMLLLHVGLSKSGTTALQQLFFAKHPLIRNVGKPDYAQDQRMMALRNWVMGEGPADPARDAFRHCVAPLLAGPNPVVISEENFSAKVPERRAAARRLYDMFGGARILITVREPVAMLESLYIAWLTHAGNRYPYMPIEAWLEHQWRLWQDDGDSYMFRADGAAIADIYAGHFGAENVKIMLFEQLRSDPMTFCRQLAGFMQMQSDPALDEIGAALSQSKINQRKTTYDAGLARLPLQQLRPLIPGFLKSMLRRSFDKGTAAKTDIGPVWQSRLTEWSVASNLQLRDRWGLAVEQYGYAV
jgi:hypothetical protein